MGYGRAGAGPQQAQFAFEQLDAAGYLSAMDAGAPVSVHNARERPASNWLGL